MSFWLWNDVPLQKKLAFEVSCKGKVIRNAEKSIQKREIKVTVKRNKSEGRSKIINKRFTIKRALIISSKVTVIALVFVSFCRFCVFGCIHEVRIWSLVKHFSGDHFLFILLCFTFFYVERCKGSFSELAS